MLKSYAVEKIMQIMKKSMVEFISAESSVYLFLDPHLVMSGGVQSGPRQPVEDYH